MLCNDHTSWQHNCRTRCNAASVLGVTMLKYAESMGIYVTHSLTSLATVSDSQVSLLTRWNGIGSGNHDLCVDPVNGYNGGPALFIPFGGSICKTFSHHATYTLGFRL